PVAIDAPTAKQFTALLLDPKSFSNDPKPCEPLPGVKVWWTKGPGKVEIVFCFECSTLYMYSQEGQQVAREFDPVEKAFAGLMKKVFPGDADIRSLK